MFSPPLTKVDVDFSETTDKGRGKQKMLSSSLSSQSVLLFFGKMETEQVARVMSCEY